MAMAALRRSKNPYRDIEVYLQKAETEISRTFEDLSSGGNSSENKVEPKSKRFLKGPAARRAQKYKQRRSRTVEIRSAVNDNALLKQRTAVQDDSQMDPRSFLAPLLGRLDRARSTGKIAPEAALRGTTDLLHDRVPHGSARSSSVRHIPTVEGHRGRPSHLNVEPMSRAMSTSVVQRRELSADPLDRMSVSTPKLDFSNPESITRWTSQILAEIDSLPGSSLDLSVGAEENNNELCKFKNDGPEALSQSLITVQLDEACVQLRECGVMSTSTPGFFPDSPINAQSRRVAVQRSPTNNNNNNSSVHRKLSANHLASTPTAQSPSSSDAESVVTPKASPIRKASFNAPIYYNDANERPRRPPRRSPKKKRAQVYGNMSKSLGPEMFPTRNGAVIYVQGISQTSQQAKRNAENARRLMVTCDALSLAENRPSAPRPHPDRNVRHAVANILRQAEASISPPSTSQPSVNSALINKRHSVRTKSVQYDEDFLSEGEIGDQEDEGAVDFTVDSSVQQDACTQTTPFSLSRSSSFTWMSEGELDRYDIMDAELKAFNSIDRPPLDVDSEPDEPLVAIHGFKPIQPEEEEEELEEEDNLMLSDASAGSTSSIENIHVNDRHLPVSSTIIKRLPQPNAPVPLPRKSLEKTVQQKGFHSAQEAKGFSSKGEQSVPQAHTSLDRARAITSGRPHQSNFSDTAESSISREAIIPDEPRQHMEELEEGLKLLLEQSSGSAVVSMTAQSSPSSVSAGSTLQRSQEAGGRLISSSVAKVGPRGSPASSSVGRGVNVAFDKKTCSPSQQKQVASPPAQARALYGHSQQFPSTSPAYRQAIQAAAAKKRSTQSSALSEEQRERSKMVDDNSWIRYPPIQSPMVESIYDNVPNMRRQLATQGLLRPTVDQWSLLSPESQPSPMNCVNSAASTMGLSVPQPSPSHPDRLPRDVSMASGILADSESSPLSPDRGFAILDAVDAAALVTPDSNKSIATSSSEGSFNVAMSPHRERKNLAGEYALVGPLRASLYRSEVSAANSSSSSDTSPTSPDRHCAPSLPRVPAHRRRSASPSAQKQQTVGTRRPSSPQHHLSPSPLDVARQQLAANSLPSLDRAGSCDPLLHTANARAAQRAGSGNNLNSQGSDSGFSSSKEKAEAEAIECCKWLRAAGFPQYASMYEDHQFPIDINSVRKDHEFLDPDSLQALFRRLHILNGCANMKLDTSVVMRRHGEEESDDEDAQVALSRQWRYQRKSKTWSRIQAELQLPTTDSSPSPNAHQQQMHHRTTTAHSSTKTDRSHNTALTGDSLDSLPTFDTIENKSPMDLEESVHEMVAEAARYQRQEEEAALRRGGSRGSSAKVRRQGPLLRERNRSLGPARTTEDIGPEPVGRARGGRGLQRSQSERIKDKARALMRRMGTGASVRATRRPGVPRPNDRDAAVPLEIGSPVLISHRGAQVEGTSTMLDSAATAASPSMRRRGAHSGDSTKRRGLVMNESSSSEFEKVDVSGSPMGLTKNNHQSHHQSFLLDSNSNIADKMFLPPRQGSLDRPNSSPGAPRPGIRTNANFSRPSANMVVTPAPSPLTDRSNRSIDRSSSVPQEPVQIADDDGSVPLILFNPNFSGTGSRGSSPAVHSSLQNGLDSSPELGVKCQRLQVQVGVGGAPASTAQQSHSSVESSDTDTSPRYWEAPERRDSGVGSSLSRSPTSGPRSRVRWHSFQRQHRPHLSSRHLKEDSRKQLHVDSLSLPQLITIRQLATLQLTALMERYSRGPRNGPGGFLGVHKLFKKIKTADYKGVKDRQVFGIPLSVIAQRTGQPLPQCILHAMRYLRQQAPEAVGIFRKSGVRSRIDKLKIHCETSRELAAYEPSQAYDVADMLKSFFRELPEPLLSSKLSDTFISIQLDIPSERKLEAMQDAVLLLPDENREVLQSLLLFLHDVALSAATNQMHAQNLAVCFAPSLFQMSARLMATSPTRRHKTISGGLPNDKELRENAAAQSAFCLMIKECKRLFMVPSSLMERCDPETLREGVDPTPLAELGLPGGDFRSYLNLCITSLLKEHRDRWKGWMTEGNLDGVEITYKKSPDAHPLKLWRCWADVEAPPTELLQRVLRERDVYDEDAIKWRVVKEISDDCEVFQYVQNDMPPHPTRDFALIRHWKTDLGALRGGCVLVETSVTLPEAPLMGGCRALCLASRYLIEPSGAGRSRITYVARIDMRGRGKQWYSKVFGYICARQVARLRDSFRQTADGPETKV